MNDEDLDAFLEHHGIKGMRWGVRNEDPLVGRKLGPIRDINDAAVQSDQLERKYGPYKGEKEKDEDFRITPLQKKIALGVGGALILGGAIYVGHKYLKGTNLQDFGLAGPQDLNTLVDAYQNPVDLNPINQIKDLKLLSEKPLTELAGFNAQGIAAHWENGVDLPAGSVFQRLSTIKETDIRPQGFFAAFDPVDVERYTAELPKWWKRWGYKETSGFLVQLKSVDPIKAPSGKETFDMFKELIDQPHILDRTALGSFVQRLPSAERAQVIDGLAKQNFVNFTAQWANGYDNHPDVQEFFGIAKKRGFNSLIDFNDSGRLARTPMRLLDGEDFKIAGHIPVSEQTIQAAQAKVKELVMAAINQTDQFLEHFGIRGMRWGVRNDSRNALPRKTDKEARKDAEEFARAKLFFGQGAGTRRKLIKATVEAKSKKDPVYKKAFERHLSDQDLSSHAQGARKERSRTDRRDRTKKRAGFIARRFTGEMGTQAAFTAVVLGGGAFLASPKGRSIMNKGVSSIKNVVESTRLQRKVNNLIRNAAR